MASAPTWLTQVPASVDRAVAMATVTSGKLALPLTEDYESKQALNIAQVTDYEPDIPSYKRVCNLISLNYRNRIPNPPRAR